MYDIPGSDIKYVLITSDVVDQQCDPFYFKQKKEMDDYIAKQKLKNEMF